MEKYIADFIQNNLSLIISGCTKPQKKSIKEVVRGLYRENTTVLKKLVQNKKLNIARQRDKYSYHLQKIDLITRINDFAFRRLIPLIKDDDPLCYDLSDIAKPHAESIENIGNIWDGSQKKGSTGFFLPAVSVPAGVLYMEVFDQDKKFLPQTRKEIIEKLTSKLDNKGIWLFDRGNDDLKLFLQMEKKDEERRFICRLKCNRQIIMKKTGEIMSVGDISPGDYEVYIPKDKTKNVWRLVISKHLAKDDAQPLRLITNLDSEFNEQAVAKKYLERWKVEKDFRRTKEKFGIEDIRLLNYQAIQNIIALVHFCMIVSDLLYRKIKNLTDLFSEGVRLLYQKFLRLQSLQKNPDSFLSFIAYVLPIFSSRAHSPPNHLQSMLFYIPS